jgi:hypothetical protein
MLIKHLEYIKLQSLADIEVSANLFNAIPSAFCKGQVLETLS